jgi:hypothetical protein
LVAGNHVPAELRAVDAAQAGVRAAGRQHRSVAACVSASIVRTAGNSGLLGNDPGRSLR